MNGLRPLIVAIITVVALTGLSACGSDIKREAKYPTGMDRNSSANANDIYSQPEGIFGNEGSGLFGRSKEDKGTTGIGVNSFLWRASLDTVSFMPLASADPFGGVILTDWYAPPSSPSERFKLNVFILDRQLRSDGIQVKIFKQTRRNNEWQDTTPSLETGRELEDAILTRARQMRVAQMGNDQ